MARKRSKGEGTVYQRADKLWVAQITLPNGKRKAKYGKTQKEVRDWLLRQRETLRDGDWVEADKVTVTEFLDRYLTDIAAHTLRPKTLEAYEYLIRLHIKPELGSTRLSALRPDQLQRLYSAKLNAGLSHRTVQFIHSVLHKSLSHALKWGLVNRNIADLVDPPTVKRKERPTYSAEQVKLFLEHVRGHRWEPIYRLATGTGLREGELLGVILSDVDLETGILHVRHAIQYLVGKGLVLSDPKSDSSRRAIPLPGFALEAVKKQLAYRAELKAAAGADWQENQLLFTTGNGTPIAPRNLIRHYQSVLEQTGLPVIRFHDFSRHTHATLLLAAGVHPKVVQERLGHSQISLTLDTYSHVIPSLQEEAAEKLNKILPL